jgi:hypothetical protein
MTYSDFTLADMDRSFGVRVEPADLFPPLAPVAIPGWLTDTLGRGRQLSLVSEKARSEFIVAPILLAARELSHDAVSIYSGQRLDVRPDQGLTGECDFILAATPPMPLLRAPILTVVEAKKNDVEGALGQCAAQMIGARQFNEQEGQGSGVVFGCVTTGEAWQFLRLTDSVIGIDRSRLYIDAVGLILAALLNVLGQTSRRAGA